MKATDKIPVAILGGTGYVAGELVRLLANHPHFELRALVTQSRPGEPVGGNFPHLAGILRPDLCFVTEDELCGQWQAGQSWGLFAATPHGTTAALLDRLLSHAETTATSVRAVDLSADFRFADGETFSAVYGKAHGASARLSQFSCAVPEHLATLATPHVAHPGCFTTAVVLAAHPFVAHELVEERIFVAAITGSSGSGRALTGKTHHPERRSNLFAYAPLVHRHQPEMQRLLGAAGGQEPQVELVTHAGPFVRGIHATLRLTLRREQTAAELVELVNAHYAASPFVNASADLPELTAVIGTNTARLGIAVRGTTLVVTSVIDNLIKGAAGGGVQWMNRLFGFADDAGLRYGGLGWL